MVSMESGDDSSDLRQVGRAGTCWHQNIRQKVGVCCQKIILTNYGDAVKLFKDFSLDGCRSHHRGHFVVILVESIGW